MKMNRYLVSALLFLTSTAQSMPSPAIPHFAQNNPTRMNSSTYQTTRPLKQGPINWSSLCQGGQLLEDNSGCMPDCTDKPTAATCNIIFQNSRIEQLTGIQSPFQSDGVILFALPQKGVSRNAILNVLLHQAPRSYGYVCEVLNSDATPASIWDTNTKAFTNHIIMDQHIKTPPYKSSNFVNVVAQGTNGEGYWHSNPNNPLYLICLSYTVDDKANFPQSTSGCGGTSGSCVSYSLQ
jgi:hypothetical protein